MSRGWQLSPYFFRSQRCSPPNAWCAAHTAGARMSFDIALTYRAGESTREFTVSSDTGLLAITGSSGSGKTTSLDCIAGLRRPLGGHVRIGGEVLLDSAAGIDLPPERRRS